MGPRRAPALLALAAFLVVCAAVLPAPVVAVDMLRRAGDAAAATGAADGVAVIRAQCEHRISALEASSSAALREHEEKVASLTEERDDLAATVKRYKRGLLNLESKRKDEVAKLEQALRLAESGECPTPTLADYVAPALDSIRRAWSDALAGVTDARDVAARAVWSRTRSALAAGVGARRAVISRASAAARGLFPDDTPHDDAHARETARTAVDVVIGAIVAIVIVAATSRMSSPFRAKSDRVGPTARTRIEVVDEDEEELRGGAVLEGDEGAVEWKTYRARVPDAGRVEIEGPKRVVQPRGARLPDAISAAAEAFDDKPEDFDDEKELPGPPASPEEGDASDGAARDDDEDDDEEAPDPVAAEEKFVEVLRERAPPARVPARVVQTRSPAPMPSLSARASSGGGGGRPRAAPAPRTPPQATAGRSSRIPRLHPGSAPSASAADVLDLNSASDDLLSQHPWGDDGGEGWADAMGTPDFQKKENKLGSPSKLPVARRAAGARRVSAPLVQTTSPNVAYAPGVNPNPKPTATPPSGKLRLVRPGERRTPTSSPDDGSASSRRYSLGGNRSSSLGLTPDNKQITPRQRAIAYAEARRKGVDVDLPSLGGEEGEYVPRGGMRHRGALR